MNLLTEVVQSNEYYKSRAVSVMSEVGLTTDQHPFRAIFLLLLLSAYAAETLRLYTSAILEVMWYEKLYNTNYLSVGIYIYIYTQLYIREVLVMFGLTCWIVTLKQTNSKSSRAMIPTFGLIPLGKIWPFFNEPNQQGM